MLSPQVLSLIPHFTHIAYFHSAAEFIIYKLREMGKISQEDISLVMKEFEDLDVDQSGTLSTSDIILAQNPQTNG